MKISLKADRDSFEPIKRIVGSDHAWSPNEKFVGNIVLKQKFNATLINRITFNSNIISIIFFFFLLTFGPKMFFNLNINKIYFL